MKTFFALVLVCSLSVLYSPAWGERRAAEPEKKQGEAGAEQTERSKSSDDSSRERGKIMFEIQEGTSGMTKSDRSSDVNKKTEDSKESIDKNI